MNCIILIGMPGAGKSTVGVLLAKALGFDFIDTDLIIQRHEKRTLQEIIDSDGLRDFIETENRIVAGISAHDCVIATGGSVIYGREAMSNLRSLGRVVYLRAGFDTISGRISNITTRGVAMSNGQSLKSVYEERCPIYERYADVTVDTCGSVEQTVADILSAVSG